MEGEPSLGLEKEGRREGAKEIENLISQQCVDYCRGRSLQSIRTHIMGCLNFLNWGNHRLSYR